MAITLITGTSTGIGRASALCFARAGHRTYATMRDVGKAKPLREAAERDGLPLEVLSLDVTRDDSVALGVRGVLEREGRIDVLVNNAGIGGAAPLEEVPDAEHRAMFETNYFGSLRMIQAVLPGMRARGSGAIVNVTSVAGRVAVPCQIPYSASKHALEALSEALAHEVRAHGIRVAIVEPGVFATSIFDNSAPATRYDRGSPYKHVMRRNGKMYARLLREPGDPDRVAEVILQAATGSEPRLRHVVGWDARGLIEGRRAIPDEAWVELGDNLSDADYNARFHGYFGIDL